MGDCDLSEGAAHPGAPVVMTPGRPSPGGVDASHPRRAGRLICGARQFHRRTGVVWHVGYLIDFHRNHGLMW
jgi:hypothetical protein